MHKKWLLNQLSYAAYIHQTKDSMHSANNTIRDSLKVLKPNTSEPEFENRTRKTNVIESCREFRIFPFVYAVPPTFPWILTKEEVQEHDNRFKHVLGAFSLEIPKRVLRFGKARNSHDTIQYAINGWAAWGHYNTHITARSKPSDKYVLSKLRLFNCIGTLFSGRFKKSNLSLINKELEDCLIEHAALFPPSECTYALHELIHVGTQIIKVGPPRFNSLFMFERVNLFLKRMIKNKNSHAASIIKAYAKEEFITQIVGFNFQRLVKIINTLSCMPSNYNLVKKILSSFNNIHVDRDAGKYVIYSIPNCRVHELRGDFSIIYCDDEQRLNVSSALASLARTDSVLGDY